MKDDTGNGRNDGIGKSAGNGNRDGVNRGRILLRKGIAAVLLALAFGLGMAALTVRAEEQGKENAEQSAAWSGLSSRGSLVYQEGEKEAAVYAADFLLLHEKLVTIPEEGFDPARYTHTHQWEYRNVNEKSHTKHCGICGDAFDLENAHSVSYEEDYTICHEGVEYPGRRYRCVCGWQWEREACHVIVFEAVDEINHRSRCLLENTAFCRGYEPVTEEHYAYQYNPCEDGTHHRKSCIDCGFEGETEECSYTLEAKPGDGDDRDTAILYCMCGNSREADAERDQTGTDASGDAELEGQDITGEEAPDGSGTSEETAGERPEDETPGEPTDEPGEPSDKPEEAPDEKYL